MSNDKCQCGCETTAEPTPRPYGFAEALRRYLQAASGDPVIRVEFTKAEAQILWPTIQGLAEELAERIESLMEEHRTIQELADNLYRELGRTGEGANCGE